MLGWLWDAQSKLQRSVRSHRYWHCAVSAPVCVSSSKASSGRSSDWDWNSEHHQSPRAARSVQQHQPDHRQPGAEAPLPHDTETHCQGKTHTVLSQLTVLWCRPVIIYIILGPFALFSNVVMGRGQESRDSLSTNRSDWDTTFQPCSSWSAAHAVTFLSKISGSESRTVHSINESWGSVVRTTACTVRGYWVHSSGSFSFFPFECFTVSLWISWVSLLGQKCYF